MENHAHHGGVEPAPLERQGLGARDASVHAELLGARDHRRGGIDGPDAGELTICERLGEPARAAADLEHALARGARRAVRSPRTPPTSWRRRAGAPRSARRNGRSHSPQAPASSPAPSRPRRLTARRPRSRSRSGRAPPLTSAGSPRSRNGTSIRSKSRGKHGGRKHRTSLAQQLGAEVARRDVREREQPDAGVAGDLGRLDRRRVHRLGGARRVPPRRSVASWTSTSAPCEEQRDRLGRRGVARIDDRPPGAGRAERAHPASAFGRREARSTRLAAARRAPGRTGRRAHRPSRRRSARAAPARPGRSPRPTPVRRRGRRASRSRRGPGHRRAAPRRARRGRSASRRCA